MYRMEKDTENIKYSLEKAINQNKIYINIVLYAGGTVLSIYLLGLVFKLTAKSIRHFNEFKLAIHGK
jgi:hypothetical protein